MTLYFCPTCITFWTSHKVHETDIDGFDPTCKECGEPVSKSGNMPSSSRAGQ